MYHNDTDGNLSALRYYQDKLEKFEHVEAKYIVEAQPILDQIEALSSELRHLAMHYEHEYGYEFDWKEDIDNVVGV